MRKITRAAFAELAKVSRAAITKAVREHRLDVIGEGRAGRIDADCYKSIQYLKISNFQRDEPSRTKLTARSIKSKRVKTRPKKPAPQSGKILPFRGPAGTKDKKAATPSGKELHPAGPKLPTDEEIHEQSEIDKKIEELNSLGERYTQAKTEKIEQQAIAEKLKNARIRGELVDREKVYNNMFTYLDKLHSNFERLADSYLSDIGPLMIDAGKVMPEHRSVWKDEVLSQIDESKNAMVKILDKIAKEQK